MQHHIYISRLVGYNTFTYLILYTTHTYSHCTCTVLYTCMYVILYTTHTYSHCTVQHTCMYVILYTTHVILHNPPLGPQITQSSAILWRYVVRAIDEECWFGMQVVSLTSKTVVIVAVGGFPVPPSFLARPS